MTNQTQPTVSKTTELGSKLKAARQAKGLSISNISEQFFITNDIVQQIEDGNYELKDLTLFLRGYIRHYADLVDVPKHEVNAAFESLGWQAVKQFSHDACQMDHSSCAGFIDGKCANKSHIIGFVILVLFIGSVLAWHALHNNNAPTLPTETAIIPVQETNTAVSAPQQNTLSAEQESSNLSANISHEPQTQSTQKASVSDQTMPAINKPMDNHLAVKPLPKSEPTVTPIHSTTTPAPAEIDHLATATSPTNPLTENTDRPNTQTEPNQPKDDSITGLPWRTNV